jgi:hypothetical protein
MGKILIYNRVCIAVMQEKQSLHLFVFSRKWLVLSIRKQLLIVKKVCSRINRRLIYPESAEGKTSI